ncbi:MAG: DeoR/GlpR family DNA-binding transcription regulator [Geminicoccaceae bacterium]
MIAAQRRALILEQVRAHGGASINELAAGIGVSLSTVRRDLDYLTEEGYLVRSHGGALLAEPQRSTFEPRREIGAHLAHAAKVAIGKRAAELLEDGQSVIFDSSSTVLEAARAAVARRLSLTACTNDIGTAAVLAQAEQIHTVVLGGTIRPGSLTLTGEPGPSFLGRLHADVTLLGIHSLAHGRLSETSLEVAAIKRRMVESSGRVIVLADSSKFQFQAFCDVCPIQRVHAVVTDDGLLPALRQELADMGTEVILAPLAGAA